MAKVIVIGAGPAGIMAAIHASKKHNVILLDGNDRIGKKLFITGKGRCNVTNAKDISEFFDYIPGNPHFLYSALYSYTNEDTINFFENAGIKLKTERGGRIFPMSDKSSDIIKGLSIGLKEANVQVKLNSKVTNIIYNNDKITGVEINNTTKLNGDHFILATGGASYPLTGSTGDGYTLAKKIGHTITDIRPSLVPIVTEESWVKDIMGLSLRNVEVSVISKNKVQAKQFGEMMFTHFGLTGPTILSLSHTVGKLLRKKNPQITIEINLKPALTAEVLDKRLQKDFDLYSKKQLSNGMKDLLPVNLIPIVIKLAELDPSKPINQITKEERLRLCHVLQHMTLTVKELRPVAEAIVTAGGISLKEFSPKTMESKLVKGLYGAGEVLDIDAFTGGYNLQAAFSTGYVAAMHAVHGDEE